MRALILALLVLATLAPTLTSAMRPAIEDTLPGSCLQQPVGIPPDLAPAGVAASGSAAACERADPEGSIVVTFASLCASQGAVPQADVSTCASSDDKANAGVSVSNELANGYYADANSNKDTVICSNHVATVCFHVSHATGTREPAYSFIQIADNGDGPQFTLEFLRSWTCTTSANPPTVDCRAPFTLACDSMGVSASARNGGQAYGIVTCKGSQIKSVHTTVVGGASGPGYDSTGDDLGEVGHLVCDARYNTASNVAPIPPYVVTCGQLVP